MMSKTVSESRRSVVRTVVNCVLSFLLCVAFSCLALTTSLYLRLFGRNGFDDAVTTSRLAEKICESVQSEVSSLPLNLPDEVINQILDRSIMYADINAGLDGFFEEHSYTGDKFRKNCEEVLRLYCYNAGFDTMEDFEDILSSTVDNIYSVYASHVRIPFSTLYKTGRAFAGKAAFVSVFAVVVLLPMSVVSIRQMYTRRKFVVFRYLYFAIMSAGITLAAPSLWLKASGFFEKLGLDPVYLKDFVVALFGSEVNLLLVCAAVYALAGAAMLAVYLKKQSRYESLDRSIGEETEFPKENEAPDESQP